MGFDDQRSAGANILIGQQMPYRYRVTNYLPGVGAGVCFHGLRAFAKCQKSQGSLLGYLSTGGEGDASTVSVK
jgi:hypothetical protein